MSDVFLSSDGNRGSVRAHAAFTRFEVITVVSILTVLAVGWAMRPRVRGCKEISYRVVCGANLRAIGNTMLIYAATNSDEWPTPAFDESAVGQIKYTVPIGGGDGTRRSPSRDQQSESGPGGAREISTSGVFWMLIRSGETVPKTYVCPTSGDRPAPLKDIPKYYDFADDSNLSYGLHVPFGPRMTRVGEWTDPRVPIAADRGPFTSADVPSPPAAFTGESDLKAWAAYNSPNSHWNIVRDGQNIYYMDGHVDFESMPLAGIDHDNIYTVAGESDDRVRGESPWVRNAVPAVPEMLDGKPVGATDSLIFP